MTSKFNIHFTNTFKQEFSSIIHYLKYTLKELITADNFYKLVIQKILSLESMPERNKRFTKLFSKIIIL